MQYVERLVLALVLVSIQLAKFTVMGDIVLTLLNL